MVFYSDFFVYLAYVLLLFCSDTMGNKGAFITMNGKDMKPHFTTYEAVPHPDVKPMAYANSMMSLFG